jgi:hypothetical protein
LLLPKHPLYPGRHVQLPTCTTPCTQHSYSILG